MSAGLRTISSGSIFHIDQISAPTRHLAANGLVRSGRALEVFRGWDRL